MDVKNLRNGTFLRCYNNDNINIDMTVNFTNTNIIEPYFELNMDNVINLPLSDINKNYNLMRDRFSSPLRSVEKPIELWVDYQCTVNGTDINIIQDITNQVKLGENRIDLLGIYTINGVTLQSLIGDNTYEIVGDFKLFGHLKKLPQVQLPYFDLVIKINPFYSNIHVIS